MFEPTWCVEGKFMINKLWVMTSLRFADSYVGPGDEKRIENVHIEDGDRGSDIINLKVSLI